MPKFVGDNINKVQGKLIQFNNYARIRNEKLCW